MTMLNGLPPSPGSVGEDEQEKLLWQNFRDDPSGRERLFSYYAPFARRIAKRHYLDRTGNDIEFADLHQLACAGLLGAIDHFDSTRGVPFRHYARRRISGSVLDGISKMSELREQISFRKRLRVERTRSLLPLDEASSIETDPLQALVEVAIGLALGFMLEGTALYVAEDEPVTYSDAYGSLLWKQTIQHIMEEVSRIPEREQAIIRHHYGDELSFDQIATLLGLSKGRISQLHRAALTLLRNRLRHPERFILTR